MKNKQAEYEKLDAEIFGMFQKVVDIFMS